MTENRAHPRGRTFLKGTLSFQNGIVTQDCLVRDLGEGGVRVETPEFTAAEACEIHIPARNLRVAAKMAWRQGNKRGYAFQTGEASPED